MSVRPGRSASARTTLILIGIAVLAVVLRIGAIVYTHATHAPAEENRIIARNLAAGRGFTFTEFTVTGPTAIRGPAYPMLLAVVGPNRMKVILAINVIAGAATVFAAYALTRRLLSYLPAYREREPDAVPSAAIEKSSFAPLLAAFLFATWPTQLYAATLTQGLSLSVLLTLASLASAFRRTPGSLISAGLLAGLAALTEPVLALPLLLCAVVLGWRDRQRLWHWQDAAVFVFTAMVLIAPWLYRNAIVFGRPMPITSNFWRDAFLGNGDNAGGSIHHIIGGDATNLRLKKTRIDQLSPKDYDQFKVPEPARIGIYRKLTLGWIETHPFNYVKLSFSRFFDWMIGSWFHPLASAYACCLPSFGTFAFAILLPRFRGPLQSTVIALAVGLSLPAWLTVLNARLIPLLDIAGIMAYAAGLAQFAEEAATKTRRKQ